MIKKLTIRQRSRPKGLGFVREVKFILQGLGHQTEGPGYIIVHIPKFIEGQKIMIPVQSHKDFFGVFDLISFHGEYGFAFHQISTLDNKQAKINALIKKGMKGNVWCRCKENNKVMYRTWFVDSGEIVTEGENYYLSSFKKK